ncbi:MAG: hypothetical protein KA153_00090 [Hyphomonadaceae bacterium]|nr:hypothetical protein [Hyphomonadaceae bacterium]
MSGGASYGELTKRLHEMHQTGGLADLGELCGPFVLEATAEFDVAPGRILFVGQETNGWYTVEDFLDPQKGLAEALLWYREFGLAENHPASRSPFWTFHRKIAQGIGIDWRALLWSNLVRFDGTRIQNGRGSLIDHPSEAGLLALQRGVLAAEIDSLRINTVIFLTGPNYDHIIRNEFSDAEFSVFGQWPVRQLSQVRCLARPSVRMIRTYHPAYLRRKRLFDPVADEIIRFCL